MKNHPWPLVVILTILGISLLTVSGGVLAQELETVEITQPTEGSTVSGLMTIAGTVDFPDFMKYEIFLQTGEVMVWAAMVHGPVINGNLARLDTKTYPDGFYQLIIRTVRIDSNYNEYTGPSFLIENNLGAPLPYPEIESSFLYPPEAGALARIRNCSGDNLEFDYHSAQGFCSADDLLIEFKDQYSPVCPFVDLLLIPCEYQGTARGIGSPEGVGYVFEAEKGKIYEIIYPGDRQIYVAEIPGDKRASSDTGGLDREDPVRLQSLAEAASAPADTSETAPPADAGDTTESEEPEDNQTMLPVSGQGREANTSFIAVAIGLILFLIVAGVIAMRKRRRPVTD